MLYFLKSVCYLRMKLHSKIYISFICPVGIQLTFQDSHHMHMKHKASGIY